MFPAMLKFGGIPDQWEKRLARYLLLKVDFLDHKTLDDLSNISGSLGANSVFALRDIRLKTERLKDILKFPKRLNITSAVTGTLTITIPRGFIAGGMVEIQLDDTKVVLELIAPPPEEPSPLSTPRGSGTPRPASPDDANDFPLTAEELAQSFLETQSDAEKQQLMSIYAEDPLAASILSQSTSSVDTEEEEEEAVGVGFMPGLPGFLAQLINGIVDNLVIRVNNTTVVLHTTLSEERGHERVTLELKMDELDIEGISRKVPGSSPEDTKQHPKKQGKRRITLENIRGFIEAEARMFGIDDRADLDESMFTARSDDVSETQSSADSEPQDEPAAEMYDSTSTIQKHFVDSRGESPTSTSPPRTPRSPSPEIQESTSSIAPPSPEQLFQPTLSQSHSSHYVDYDNSDEEELAFAPPSMRSSTKPDFMRRSHFEYDDQVLEEEDSEDDADGGGAIFGHSPPKTVSPSHSTMSSSAASFASARESMFLEAPGSPNAPHTVPGPVRRSSDVSSLSDPDSSGDEMDQEASMLLGRSAIFSREQAKMFVSASSLRGDASEDLAYQSALGGGDEDIVDAEEMDRRLDRVILGDETRTPTPSPPKSPELRKRPAPSPKPSPKLSPKLSPQLSPKPSPKPELPRKIRKECLHLDNMTIYYPSLADGVVPVETEQAPPPPTPSSSDNCMPGTFSMYASRYSIKPDIATSTPKSTSSGPRVKILDALDARPIDNSTDTLLGYDAPGKPADIEIISSHINGKVDIETEKMLNYVLETVQNAVAEQRDLDQSRKLKKKRPTGCNEERKKTLQFWAEEVDVRMINHLGGKYLDNDEEDEADETVQLHCLLNDVKLLHRGLADDASTSQLNVRKFALGDEEEGIITFLPARSAQPAGASSKSAAKMSHSAHHRKRSSTSTPGGGLLGHSTVEDDIVVIFSQNTRKVRINVRTLPLRIRGNLQRLEAMFSAFGGVGNVLASTNASTATIKGMAPDDNLTMGSGSAFLDDTKIDAKIGGLLFDVVGQTAAVNLESTPIKVDFTTKTGLAIEIDKIEISGPKKELVAAKIVVDKCRMGFASRPSQEDLTRLLELLVPSKDRYDDPDIMIDTLLRQREQGSVLKISVAGVRTEVHDLKVFDKFKELGDEVLQLLSVTDFVAGDERPGLLTLVDVHEVQAFVEVGGSIGRIVAEMDSVGMTHVTAPALLALGVGHISVGRQDHELLLGQALDRNMFSRPDFDRPMIMVRMIGDELEPVIKVKLWNIRLEYSVETLLALMQKPAGTTGEDIAQDMVQSIVGLPQQTEKAEINALGFDLVIKDSIIALNPLNLNSRALLVLSDAQLQAALPSGASLSAVMEIEKANVMLIDDAEHLVEPDNRPSHGKKPPQSGLIAGFASMGYVSVLGLTKAVAKLSVNGDAVDLDVTNKLILIESCADSTQTLIAILNGLSPPKVETNEVKYCTEVMPINMLQSLSEDAFLQTIHDDDVDALVDFDDGVPTNLRFVDSYYGHKSPPKSPSEELVESMMVEEDYIRTPPPSLFPSHSPSVSFSREGSGSGSLFKEKVTMLADEPIKYIENHFGGLGATRRGRRALNQEAVDQAQYFPLNVNLSCTEAIWNLHDGYDWQRTRDTITKAVQKVETKVAERQKNTVSFDIEDDEESLVDDFLFNSIYIGVAGMKDPRDLRDEINRQLDDQASEASYATESSRPTSSRSRAGPSRDFHGKKLRLARSKKHKLQIELRGVNVELLLFPPDSKEVQSSIDVRVCDLVIYDKMPSSTWIKFVTYCHDSGERELGSDMIRLEVLVVKPVPELAATELVIKVNVLPLRLHVDQDALDFLTRFFEFKDDAANLPPSDAPQPEPPFLQRVEVNAVHIKLDYKPKKVDYAGLRSGHTTEFMNFFILEEANLILRRITLHGISGLDRMGKILNDTWSPDVTRNQLGGVLAGVAPVRSLVNIGRAATDLVVVPVREYQKDGRIVRSLQKGVHGFVRNTTGELVRFGAKVAVGTQTLLQATEGVLSGTSDHQVNGFVEFSDDEDSDDHTRRVISLYADQPETVAAGLRAAGAGLRRNFREAREAVLRVPTEMAMRGDAIGAVGAVARAAPVAVLRPMVGVTEAVSRTLMGVGNAMEPEGRRRREEKYKRH